MGSNRICEIIGVGVNNEFMYEDSVFRITEDGYIEEWEPDRENWVVAEGGTICEMISAELSFWTITDKTNASNALEILPYKYVYRDSAGTAYLCNESSYQDASVSGEKVKLMDGTFPSLKNGEIYKLEGIMDGGNVKKAP